MGGNGFYLAILERFKESLAVRYFLRIIFHNRPQEDICIQKVSMPFHNGFPCTLVLSLDRYSFLPLFVLQSQENQGEALCALLFSLFQIQQKDSYFFQSAACLVSSWG